jgi:hypothetical protein
MKCYSPERELHQLPLSSNIVSMRTVYFSDDETLMPTTPVLSTWTKNWKSSRKSPTRLSECSICCKHSYRNVTDFESCNLSYLPFFLFSLLVTIPYLLSLVLKMHAKPCGKHSLLMIIRHAEKPAGGDWLSSDGRCRARKLSSCFNDDHQKKPDMLLTYIPTSERSSMRGLETLLPLSKEIDIQIYPYKTADYVKMSEYIRTRICGRTSLLVWHHNPPGIADIAREFGLNETIVEHYVERFAQDYDVVWMIKYISNGKKVVANLSMEFQGFGIEPCKVARRPSELPK